MDILHKKRKTPTKQKLKTNKDSKIKKFSITLNYIYSYLINLFLFEYLLLLLPEGILTDEKYRIQLKLGEIGDQQIFSDEYNISQYYPYRIKINNELHILRNKKILLENIDHLIDIEWNNEYQNFSYMFANLRTITYANIIQNFKSQDMDTSYMFYNCKNLRTFSYVGYNSDNINDNKNFNATKMFYNCISLTSFSFNRYKQINNINLSYMFYKCENLNYAYFSNTMVVNDMREMFYNCNSLYSIHFTNFQSDSSINTSYLFYNCNNLTIFDNTNTKQIKTNNMKYMFYNCFELIDVNLDNLKFETNFNISISYAFYNCKNLISIRFNNEVTSIYISDIENMFYNCSSIRKIELPSFKTIGNINMTRMFYNCNNASQITFRSNSKFYPNDLHATFYNCKSLSSLDIYYKFITDKTIDISYLFYNCSNLTSLSLNFSNSLTKNMRGTFQNCNHLTNLYLSNFHTKKAEIMWDMFKGCSSMQSLNLSSFDTSRVTDMESMFEDCLSLSSLSLNHFKTSNVQYMNKMFKNCISLKSLYFRNINAASCGTMHQMFYNCKSLEYLDIFSITERGQSIKEMFDGASNIFSFCIADNEIIPNIFDVLKSITYTDRECSYKCYKNNNRIKVPEKKLCCPNVKYGDNCYDKCPSKTHLENSGKECVFFNCSYPYYYNYNQDYCISDIRGYYMNDSILRTIDKCHEDCKECKGGYSNLTTNCTKCNEEKPYIFQGNCYKICEPGYDTYYDKCKCFNRKCRICSEASLEYDLCEECNDFYYQKENDITNYNGWVNCYRDPENYFLDNDRIYKKCYKTCRYCNGIGNYNNHLCFNCTDEFPFGIINETNNQALYNCYPNCSYYYYFDTNNTYQCTPTHNCITNYSKLIDGTRECISSCNETKNTKYEYQSKCYTDCPPPSFRGNEANDYFCKINCTFENPFERTQEQKCVDFCDIMDRYTGKCRTNYKGDRAMEVQDLLYSNLQEDMIESFQYDNINDNFSIILREENHTYEIITTEKMKIKNNETRTNTSRILLKECENHLKDFYQINQSESLYILKLDAKREGLENPIVQFLVYYPLDGDRLEQLDLTICEGDEIIIAYPTNKSGEDTALFDMKSDYFNDICYKFTSEDGTDLILSKRQQLYGDNDQGQCQNGCSFLGFNPDKEVECSCLVDASQPLVSEMKIDKDMLYKFMDIQSIINFKVMKCYKLLLSVKALMKNIGFFAFIPTFILYFVCFITFYARDYFIIKKEIYDIAEALKKLKYLLDGKLGDDDLIEEKYKSPSILNIFKFKGMKVSKKLRYVKTDEQSKTNIQNNIQINFNLNNNKIKNNNINTIIKEETKEEENNIDNINTKDNPNKINISKNNPENKNAPPFKNSKPFIKDKLNLSGKNKKNNLIETKSNAIVRKGNRIKFNLGSIDKIDDIKSRAKQEDKEFIKRVLRLTDTELNDLDYKQALKYDHRNYKEYYMSLLKTKHILMVVCNKRDYNSMIIKLYLFFFSFSSNYAMNALFFDDDAMNEIYEEKGEYNFIDQAPQIIYSFILSYILDNIFNFLALSEDDALNLKHEKIFNRIEIVKSETMSGYKIKFAFFFLFSLASLVFFWYYIACFCAVYENTQIHLLSDSLISFGTSLLTPFAIYLLAPLIRINTLKTKSRTNEMLFNFGQMITIF